MPPRRAPTNQQNPQPVADMASAIQAIHAMATAMAQQSATSVQQEATFAQQAEIRAQREELRDQREEGLRYEIKESVKPLEIRQFQALVEKCKKVERMKQGRMHKGVAGGLSRTQVEKKSYSINLLRIFSH
ncbi:hypothetical protein KIW84_035091 [Lathyrus oleraceus]|uniref:Uncharacterized protein n=1 Tax=Pisum sativum TaxID=3888 RepID=A0A9D4Y1B3_PEA|nr:hypothetical protein KIW84_035091 [Pisum sativum]